MARIDIFFRVLGHIGVVGDRFSGVVGVEIKQVATLAANEVMRRGRAATEERG